MERKEWEQRGFVDSGFCEQSSEVMVGRSEEKNGMIIYIMEGYWMEQFSSIKQHLSHALYPTYLRF